MKETKVIFFYGMDPENIETYFNTQYNRWLFQNSDLVKIDGQELDKSMRYMLTISFENDFPPCSVVECSGVTKRKTPLEKSVFIAEQLKKSTEIYETTKGSELNRDTNYRAKIYIDYLNKISKPLEFPEIDHKIWSRESFEVFKYLYDEWFLIKGKQKPVNMLRVFYYLQKLVKEKYRIPKKAAFQRFVNDNKNYFKIKISNTTDDVNIELEEKEMRDLVTEKFKHLFSNNEK